MALYEIRTYPVKEGCMEEWVTFMENRVVPYIEERGMKVDAMFRAAEDDSVYTWIRHFDDEAHRQELHEKVYGSAEWQTQIKPTVQRLVDVPNATVLVMHATACSPLK